MERLACRHEKPVAVAAAEADIRAAFGQGDPADRLVGGREGEAVGRAQIDGDRIRLAGGGIYAISVESGFQCRAMAWSAAAIAASDQAEGLMRSASAS